MAERLRHRLISDVMSLNMRISLTPLIDVQRHCGTNELVAMSQSYDGSILALIAHKELDYRIQDSSGASFAKTKPDEHQDYTILEIYQNESVSETLITDEKYNIHYVQKHPDGLFLLTCARSERRNSDDFDLNGRIYDANGRVWGEILIGDGVEDVQIDDDGNIWIGFFDEGVFGNYGWDDPIGKHGLISMGISGQITYQYQPSGDLGMICDSYAMNVNSSKDVWICYYTDFPLVNLSKDTIRNHWVSPIHGSSAFAIGGGYVLMEGGYDDRGSYQIFQIKNNHQVTQGRKVVFYDEDDQPILAKFTSARSSTITFYSRDKIYSVDIFDIV